MERPPAIKFDNRVKVPQEMVIGASSRLGTQVIEIIG